MLLHGSRGGKRTDPAASGFSRLRLDEVRSCLASGGDQHVMARVGQFLSVMGHLLDEVGLLCELHGRDGGIAEAEQEDAGEEAEEMGLMQTTDSKRRTEEAATSSRAEPMTPSRGVREEELTPEDLAIIAACEADEAWQTLKSMRPATKQQFMSAVCIQPWTHKPLRPLAVRRQLNLHNVRQRGKQVLPQRERGKESDKKTRLLKRMTSTTERVSPMLHNPGGKTLHFVVPRILR